MLFVTNNLALKHRPFFLCIFAVLLSLLSACASNKPIILFDTPPAKPSNIAKLLIPIEIDLVYVDGNRQTFFPAYQQYVTYKLLPGAHVFGFQYQDMVLNEDGNQESVKSKTVIIRFTAEEGANYIIDFKKPASFADALKLEKTFKISLSKKSDSGKSIIASSFPAPESPVAGWLGSKPFSAEAADLFNDEILSTRSEEPAKDAKTGTHLKYWWEQASQEERSSFRQWINNNP